MTSQVRGITQAVNNAQSAVSLAQTMEGALGEMTLSVHRMRELAVQAANETNSPEDRASLQVEVDKLLKEIDRSAQGQYNGKQLFGETFDFHLDASSAQGVHFQSSALSSQELGRQAVASSSQAIDSSVAFVAGDVTIVTASGEYEIRATSTSDDQISTANRAGSAIAKAKAINSSTSLHGVTAEVEASILTGDSITSGQILGHNDVLKINDIVITVDEVLTGDADGALRDAINEVAQETGVLATMNSDGLLVLTAEDGRNIAISATGTAASLGFTDGVVQAGRLTLTASHAFGLEFSSDTANSAAMGWVTGGIQEVEAAGAVAPVAAAGGGNEPVQVAAGYSVAPFSASDFVFDNSFWNPMTKIHSITGEYLSGGGYTADEDFFVLFYGANRTYLLDAPSTGAPTIDQHIGWNPGQTNQNISFTVNGKSFNINFDAPASETFPGHGYLYLKINLKEGLLDGTFGELQDTGGGGGAAPAAPADPAPTEAYFGANMENTGLSAFDLTTTEGAERAIKAADRALEQLSTSRANLGSTINRLESSMSVMEATKNNTMSARSRISDADFANEAAEMTRTQIIQNASVSVLAQSNALPSLALSLLA